MMEKLTSRKNAYIIHLRHLASDASYRREHGEYICDGLKTLNEAVSAGASVTSVLWREGSESENILPGCSQYTASPDLLCYASPLENSPGPVFTVKIPESQIDQKIVNALILENVQDPGNVGTVIRTANAFGIDAVLLTGACADLYSPKTVRATMAAVFRQRVLRLDSDELFHLMDVNRIPVYGAALHRNSRDIRQLDLSRAAVAVGSEGKGLSDEFLSRCTGSVIIPMAPASESLNAANAASVAMWEMMRNQL